MALGWSSHSLASPKIGKSRAFSARIVLPLKFTVMKISVSNLDDRSQTLVRGTKLRVSEKAEMIGDTEGDDALSSLEPEPVVNRTKAHKKAEVIDEMIQPLPKKLNDEKPRKVQRLLKDNEGQRSYLYCSTRHSNDAFD